MEWLDHIQFWHWLIAAVIMIVIEMILPVVYFLWMSISAFIVGLLLYAIPSTPLLIQLITFGVLSVLTVVFYKRHEKSNLTEKDEPNLNRRGEQYVGQTFTLYEPIVNGIGKIKAGDSIWKVKGPDLPVGMKVHILSVDGTVFNVASSTTFSE